VLLHELSHIRRGDTAACFLAAVLSILHWFNPLVWLAFALMRRDIEVLCEDSVIEALGEHERPGYAATLLALAAPPQTPRMVTALFISHRCVKKRILAMIRRKKASVLYSAAALLLTVIIADRMHRRHGRYTEDRKSAEACSGNTLTHYYYRAYRI